MVTKLTRVLLAAKVSGVSIELSNNPSQLLTIVPMEHKKRVVFLKHLFGVEQGKISEEFLELNGYDQQRLQSAINRLITTGLIWTAKSFDYGCE